MMRKWERNEFSVLSTRAVVVKLRAFDLTWQEILSAHGGGTVEHVWMWQPETPARRRSTFEQIFSKEVNLHEVNIGWHNSGRWCEHLRVRRESQIRECVCVCAFTAQLEVFELFIYLVYSLNAPAGCRALLRDEGSLSVWQQSKRRSSEHLAKREQPLYLLPALRFPEEWTGAGGASR